ncbi:MAG: hypothetical protein R3B72_03245 [Polyangiaceae bacterium]
MASRSNASLRRASTALAALSFGLILNGCYGLGSDAAEYPDYSSSEVKKSLLSPELEERPSIGIDNDFVVSDDLCEGIDVHTETRPIAQDELGRFLARIGAPPVEVKARGNLYWFDFPGDDPDDGDLVRLRLAVLDTPEEAADELHQALLQHGPGWWGLRRGNLSILAPKASLGEAMAFAVRYKLPCWGALMVAGLDDVYVIPGPYTEM